MSPRDPSSMKRADLQTLKRSQLQRLCKSNNLRLGGNRKTSDLVDLLAAHFEEQTRAGESSALVVSAANSPTFQTATPAPSVHSQDENQELLERMSNASVTASHSREVLVLEKGQLDGPHPPDTHLDTSTSQSTNARLNTLEELCSRLLAQNTSSVVTIANLQAKLDLAEQSITTLTLTLEDTRAQLHNSQSQIHSLRSSLTASDQLANEANSAFTNQITSVRELTSHACGRLDNLDEKVRQLQDTRMPSARPGASSGPELSGPVTQPYNQRNLPYSDFPDDSSSLASSSKPRSASATGRPQTSRSDITAGPSTGSWSSGMSAPSHKSSITDLFPLSYSDSSRFEKTALLPPLSVKAAGKRPASPHTITRTLGELDGEPAQKRQRNTGPDPSSWNIPQSTFDVSPSRNSFSALSTTDLGSPFNPPSPSAEPMTPPRRTAALLPPVEIVSTPSPSGSRQHSTIKKDELGMDQSHYFATSARPPFEGGPLSPTTESPRKRRPGSEPRPPSLAPSSYRPPEAWKRERDRESMILATPPPIVIGKGRAVRAQLDPGMASAVQMSRRSASLGLDEDGDVSIADTETPIPGDHTTYRTQRQESVSGTFSPMGTVSDLHTEDAFQSGLSMPSPSVEMVTPARSATSTRASVDMGSTSTMNPRFSSLPYNPPTMPAPHQVAGTSGHTRSHSRNRSQWRFPSPLIPSKPSVSSTAVEPSVRDYAADPDEGPTESSGTSAAPIVGGPAGGAAGSSSDRASTSQGASGSGSSALRGPSPAKKSLFARWTKEANSPGDNGWMKSPWGR